MLKKLLISSSLVLLLAAGCNNVKQQSIKPSEIKTSDQPIQNNSTSIPSGIDQLKPISQRTANTQIVQPTATTTNPQVEASVNQICEKIKTEFTSFTTEYKYTNLLSSNIIQSFNSLPWTDGSSLGDFQYAYQRNLAQKDSFTTSLNSLDTEVQKVPNLSFGIDEIVTYKQMYVTGSNSYRNAFDLRLASLKMIVDEPNSIDATYNAQETNADSIRKAASAKNSFAGGTYYYNKLAQLESKLLIDNKCQ